MGLALRCIQISKDVLRRPLRQRVAALSGQYPIWPAGTPSREGEEMLYLLILLGLSCLAWLGAELYLVSSERDVLSQEVLALKVKAKLRASCEHPHQKGGV